jgi:hypothetical protein
MSESLRDESLRDESLRDESLMELSDAEILYYDLEEHVFCIFNNIIKLYNYLLLYSAGPLLYACFYIINKTTYLQFQTKKMYSKNKKIVSALITKNVHPKCISIVSFIYTMICIFINNIIGLYYAVQGRSIEPMYKEWVSTVFLESRDLDNINETEYKYNEKYMEILDSNDDECLQFIRDNQLYKLADKLADKLAVGLVVIKSENLYTYRLLTDVKLQEFDNDGELSDIRFLSIEYSHPKMKNTLYIELSKNHFLIGNQILSFVFILRYLHYNFYQNQYIFDEDYTLNIMDNNINMITINANQYCELEESIYKIVDL